MWPVRDARLAGPAGHDLLGHGVTAIFSAGISMANGDLMVVNGDLMVVNGDLMVVNGD